GISLGIFFFQAEDGIRDRTVTGVQTCALPISTSRQGMTRTARLVPQADSVLIGSSYCSQHLEQLGVYAGGGRQRRTRIGRPPVEIGRASCREGEKRAGVASGVDRKTATDKG